MNYLNRSGLSFNEGGRGANITVRWVRPRFFYVYLGGWRWWWNGKQA